jgi:hypothetical protein
MSDFKDRMIENYERGYCAYDDSYEYTREQMADAADQRPKEIPVVFMVGDRVAWDDGDEQGVFYGTVTSTDIGDAEVMVKLDAGGTYRAERRHLRRL